MTSATVRKLLMFTWQQENKVELHPHWRCLPLNPRPTHRNTPAPSCLGAADGDDWTNCDAICRCDGELAEKADEVRQKMWS